MDAGTYEEFPEQYKDYEPMDSSQIFNESSQPEIKDQIFLDMAQMNNDPTKPDGAPSLSPLVSPMRGTPKEGMLERMRG
jgi:hypothetical protein